MSGYHLSEQFWILQANRKSVYNCSQKKYSDNKFDIKTVYSFF